MKKILLIEDEVSIQELVRFNLEKDGFAVIVAGDGLSGLQQARTQNPDLVVLDLMLPVIDGYEVCKALRGDQETAQLPIIMLSARNEVVDKIIGLELGADDYLGKPFSPKELVARIRARLRERERRKQVDEAEAKITFGELELWPKHFMVTQSGKLVNLTVKEFELLHLFLSRPNQVFSREHLLQKIWGYSQDEDTRTVDVHVSNLRQKLQPIGKKIEAVRGVGYRFSASDKV